MKKAMIIITAILVVSFWLVDCRSKGKDDFTSYYIFHQTPSPSVTMTITATPYIFPTPG